MIDAVVFDIGNVLIEWQPQKFYDRSIGEPRRRAFFEAVDMYTMHDGVDRGEPFRDTVYAFAEEHPEWSAEIRMWHDNWNDIADTPIPQSVAVLRALRAKGIPVFALSNFGIESFDLSERAHPFLKEFDQRYISGHMGVIKPDPTIYEMMEAECGVAPERMIFADDRADNIAAAAARGWHTHLFTDTQGWADRLIAEGLLEQQELENA